MIRLTKAQEEELVLRGSAEEVWEELYRDKALFCRVVFPNRFKREFGPMHAGVFEALNDLSIRQLLFIMHRDFGKTSLLQLADAAWNILFEEAHFIVPISCSATQAVMQSDNLRIELSSNEIIKKFWGDLKPESKVYPFSKEAWFVQVKGSTRGTFVVPRGSGQQIRGLIFRDARPDLILVDDLEDPEELLSEDQRAKQKKWFFGTMKNIVDIAEDDWRIVCMGTIVHQDCILVDLKEDPKHWHCLDIPLCEEDSTQKFGLKTLWPQRFTQKIVDTMIDEARTHNQYDTWYMEFMNQISASEDMTFQRTMFKYYDPNIIDLNDAMVAQNVLLIDPAKTIKMNSAESGFVVAGLPHKENKWYIRLAHGRKMHPNEVIAHALELCQMMNIRVVAVEETSLEEWIRHPFEDAARAKGMSIKFIWVKSGGKGAASKKLRVGKLSTYYAEGVIEHNLPACTGLEAQLVGFPWSKRWDVMDALAILPKILEDGSMYFTYFGKQTEVDEEKDYQKLLDEDRLNELPATWDTFAESEVMVGSYDYNNYDN